MAGNGTLTEYLASSMNTICARFIQEGESRVRRVCSRVRERLPVPRWAVPVELYGAPGMAKSRRRFRPAWLRDAAMMADEILTRAKARSAHSSRLVVTEVGFPNQLKMRRALDDLELFVQVDPWMSASQARRCGARAETMSAKISPIFPNGGA